MIKEYRTLAIEKHSILNSEIKKASYWLMKKLKKSLSNKLMVIF
jgi:hypothetical protein